MTNKKSEIRGILTDLERDYLSNPHAKIDYKKDMNIRQKTINSLFDIIYILQNCSQKQKIKIVQQFQSYWEPELIDEMVNYEESHDDGVLSWLRGFRNGWDILLGRNLITEFLEQTMEISITCWEEFQKRSLASLERRRPDIRRNRQMAEREFERWSEEFGWDLQTPDVEPLNRQEFLKPRIESTFINPINAILQKYNLSE